MLCSNFFPILPLSLVLEFIHWPKRLILVAPNIKKWASLSLQTPSPYLSPPLPLDWFFPLTLESLPLSFSYPPLRATLPHLFSSQLLDLWWSFTSLGQQHFLSSLPARHYSIASHPLPRPPYCLYPHSWADNISFSKGILHSGGEFSSGW